MVTKVYTKTIPRKVVRHRNVKVVIPPVRVKVKVTTR